MRNRWIIAVVLAFVSTQLKAQYDLYVEVESAGTLEEIVTQITEDGKYETKSMKVIGPINGHDMMFIRDLCGVKDLSTPTPGHLEILDISDATMESTADPYLTVDGVGYSSRDYTFGSFFLYNCQYLKEVFLPENLNSIDSLAFANCKQLRYLEIPSSVERLGYGAFVGCDSIANMQLPDEVTQLGEGVFQQMANLQTIYLGNGIESVDNSIFLNDDNLMLIGFGKAFRDYDPVVFYNCPSLAYIDVGGGNPYYCSVDGVLFSSGMDSLLTFPPNSDFEHYEIPDSVSRIAVSAFRNARQVKSVLVPESVTDIDSMAFFNCMALSDIQLSEGLLHIAYGAFGVMEGGSSMLQELHLPSTVTEIEGGAFLLNPSLSSLAFDKGNSRYSVDGQGLLYRDGMSVLCYVPAMTADLQMPESVREIGPYAFAGVRNLPLIVTGDQVTTIGDGAFAFANGTHQITLGKAVNKIGDLVIDYCMTLGSVYLFADQIDDANIQDFAFYDESGHAAERTMLYVLPGRTSYFADKKGFRQPEPYLAFFAGIREISDPDAIAGIPSDKDSSEHAFGVDGRLMKSSERGIRIVRLPGGRSYKYLKK